jgi:hypothetical protein
MAGEISVSTDTKNRNFANLVSNIPKEKQDEIVAQIISDYQTDLDSREDWEDKRDRWYKLWTLYVGQNRKNKETGKNTPWPNASNVCVPILATAVNQFHGRSYQSIFSAPGLVKALPVSKNDIRRSKSVEDYMNWQLLHEMEEYEEVFDDLLLNLPINGTAFKKFNYSKSLERPTSTYIGATDLILPYRTTKKQFRSGLTRVTHRLYLNWDEILDRKESGIYENVDNVPEVAPDKDEDEDLKETADEVVGQDNTNSVNEPHLILECHKNYDLEDETGRQPYIFTVHEPSKTLLRVSSRKVKVGSKERVLKFFVDYHFIPNTEGFYSFGFGHFLEVLNEMANTAFNQIFDAGRLTNQPFGFYGRRAGFKKRRITLEPGSMTEVEDASQILFPQMQRLDNVLFQVLGLINTYAANFTSVTENILGREQQGVERPTARGTLALIEQGLMTFSVIVKRVYRSMKHELRLIKELNEIFLPDTKEFRISGSLDKIAFSDVKREDFGGVQDIIPVADPSFASKQVRRQEAFQLHEITMSNPLVIGTPPPKEGGEPAIKPNLQAMFQSTRNLYAAFDEPHTRELIEAIESVIPPRPLNPEEENSMFMQGDIPIPTEQDNHIVHLQSHLSFTTTDSYEKMPDLYKDNMQDHMELTNQLLQLQRVQQQPQLAGVS